MQDARSVPSAVVGGARSTGPVVALIGDSISDQVRLGLVLAGGARQWVVWSRCGATVGTALDAGAVGAVSAFHPTVVVVALGTNDAGYLGSTPVPPDEFTGNAARLLDQIGPGPCVVWVDVAQVGSASLQAQMDRVNLSIDGVAHRGIEVAKWADVVAGDPAVLTDEVHLSLRGVDQRAKLLDDAVTRCVP